jgi:hypothetical protein
MKIAGLRDSVGVQVLRHGETLELAKLDEER